MNALLNAHNQRELNNSPCARLTSGILLKAKSSQIGATSEYVQKEGYSWYVLRVVYNRIQKAQDIISQANVQSYTPRHYVVKKENGKKKRILKLLLPNLFFIYATREVADDIIRKRDRGIPVLKYYLDKTRPIEHNGKHPLTTIPFDTMQNFIRATSTENAHVRMVRPEQCHYKNGDVVKIIDGEFKGVTGRVARIAGQQRVVVDMTGVCLVATAYIPNDFLVKAKTK